MRRFAIAMLCVVASCGRMHFDPLSGGGGGGGDGGGGSDSDSDSGDGGGSGSSMVTYAPSIAECIDPTAPDPTFCRTTNGQTELPVDLDDSNLHVPFYSYLRFDFDAQIAGRTVTSVVLRAVVTNGAQSDGPETGEIWRVSTFTTTTLQTTAPTQLGGAALAASKGAVVQLQTVDWVLPPSVIDGSPLCVGMVPIVAAGVNYWNLQGATPPSLRLELQ